MRPCGNPQQRFFAGEVEPCINGQVGAVGAYFRQDVRGIVDRLLPSNLPDGGWNCDAEIGSTRSSFNTTICVLDALLEYDRTSATLPSPRRAARTGLPARATAFPPEIDRPADRAGSQERRFLAALRVPDVVALRPLARPRLPA
jgi:hypothetical protein